MTTGDKNLDNTVRYILVNDMGLTRESVRKQADDIVSQCVNAHMSKINIEQAAADAVKYTLAKEAWNHRRSVLEMVKEAAQRKAAEWVKENVQISSPTEPQPEQFKEPTK